MSAPPAALAPFLAFAPALRGAGFPAAPEQVQGFIAAVGALGPTSMLDIRRAAHALFGPPPERLEAFDAVFDAVFLGRSLVAEGAGEMEDGPEAHDAGELALLPDTEEEDPSGRDAMALERLLQRRLDGSEDDALRRLARDAPRALPRRRSRRLRAGPGDIADARRAFREMLRRDGELTTLPTRARRKRQRRVLLLIDVSGSMKEGTDAAMRLAHALVQAGERVEAFTLGTRLTRVTRALRHRNREQALALSSGLVADWDGGTRLGETLAVFLAVPRFAAFARGALVVILSDGLEKGGPEALVAAMERLRALAWGTLWLTPLAADPEFAPRTAAMQAVAPLVDRLGNGATSPAIVSEILGFSRGGARAWA